MKFRELLDGQRCNLFPNTGFISLLRIDCLQGGLRKSLPMHSKLLASQSIGGMSMRSNGLIQNHLLMLGTTKTFLNAVTIFSIWRTVLQNMQKYWLSHPSREIKFLKSTLRISCLNFSFGKSIGRRPQSQGADGFGLSPASDW